jgi:type VI secretion system secreted protein Hcp
MKRTLLGVFVALAVLTLAPVKPILAQAPTAAAQSHPFYVTVKGQTQGIFKADVVRVPLVKLAEAQIEGIKFSMQITSPRDAASGLPTGKRQYSPITFTKLWGPSSPQFLLALSRNEVLTSVTFQFLKAMPTGQEVVFQVITLTNATVSSVRRYIGLAGANEAPDTRELEDISFTFQKIEVTDKAAGGATFADDWTARM